MGTESTKIVPTGDEIQNANHGLQVLHSYCHGLTNVKQCFEKPTIGILLCKNKNDALVELTLPKDANIYAQEYALCLPKKEELQQKLREWVSEYNEIQE